MVLVLARNAATGDEVAVRAVPCDVRTGKFLWGYCYLQLIREDFFELAEEKLGEWPSGEKLLGFDAEWFVDEAVLMRLGMQVWKSSEQALIHVDSVLGGTGDASWWSVRDAFVCMAMTKVDWSEGSCGRLYADKRVALTRSELQLGIGYRKALWGGVAPDLPGSALGVFLDVVRKDVFLRRDVGLMQSFFVAVASVTGSQLSVGELVKLADLGSKLEVSDAVEVGAVSGGQEVGVWRIR